jgi:hypothetical protein
MVDMTCGTCSGSGVKQSVDAAPTRRAGPVLPTDPARLSADLVTEVGDSYLSARNTPADVVVVAAYQRLQAETDWLFQAVTRTPAPGAVRIVFTHCLDPYESDTELIGAVRSSRILEITTAATSRERIHPLLGCEQGGAFDRFRAIHDLIGHARTGLGFDLHDELAAWRIQDRLHSALARGALATELLAVNSARSIIGHTPGQKATLLDPGLLYRAYRPRDAPVAPSHGPADDDCGRDEFIRIG